MPPRMVVMALTDTFVKNVKHSGSPAGDKFSDGRADSDLRGIFARADKTKREEIKAFLLREDPVRYAWVKSSSYKKPMFNQEYPNS